MALAFFPKECLSGSLSNHLTNPVSLTANIAGCSFFTTRTRSIQARESPYWRVGQDPLFLWIPLDAPHLESKESILKISIHATHREREFKSGNLLTDRIQVTRTELSCKEWYLSVILVGTSVGARYGRFSITDTLSTVVKKRD